MLNLVVRKETARLQKVNCLPLSLKQLFKPIISIIQKYKEEGFKLEHILLFDGDSLQPINA